MPAPPTAWKAALQLPMLPRMIGMFSTSVMLRFVRLALNVALISVLGRYLGEGGMGRLLAAQAVIAVLLCVAELGFARLTVRELVRDQADEPRVLGATFFSRLVIGVALLAGLCLTTGGMAPEERLLLLTYGLLLPTHAFAELGSWMEGRRMVARNAWIQLWAFLAGALMMGIGVWLRLPLVFFPLAYVAECWATSLLQMRIYRRSGGRFSDWRWDRRRTFTLLRESWPELGAQLALVLLFRLDTIMVQLLRGSEEAGVYGAAVRISEVLYFVPTALAGVVLPQLIELQKHNRPQYERRFADYFGMTLVLAVVGAAGLAIASPLIVDWLWKGAFTGSAAILAIHAWSFIPYSLGIARTQFLAAEGRLWVNLPSVLLAVGINVLLNWLWIPRWSGLGAAWATLISYTVAWVATSFVLPQARPVAALHGRSLVQFPRLLGECWQQVRARSLARFQRLQRPASEG